MLAMENVEEGSFQLNSTLTHNRTYDTSYGDVIDVVKWLALFIVLLGVVTNAVILYALRKSTLGSK